MPKHILVISTSPRKGGNSETLANEFIRGAEESGNQVEKVCLYDKTISFCKLNYRPISYRYQCFL